MKITKTLYLVRHAKSCWDNNLSDFDRPIKSRGVKDANLVSKHLKDKNIRPEIILCSSAKRTKLTLEIFIKNLNLEAVKIVFLEDLYDFSGASLLNVLQSCDNAIDKVLIFGHNNALTNVVNQLGSVSIPNVTTSGFVQIEFQTNDWRNLKKGRTKLVVFPKNLR